MLRLIKCTRKAHTAHLQARRLAQAHHAHLGDQLVSRTQFSYSPHPLPFPPKPTRRPVSLLRLITPVWLTSWHPEMSRDVRVLCRLARAARPARVANGMQGAAHVGACALGCHLCRLARLAGCACGKWHGTLRRCPCRHAPKTPMQGARGSSRYHTP